MADDLETDDVVFGGQAPRVLVDSAQPRAHPLLRARPEPDEVKALGSGGGDHQRRLRRRLQALEHLRHPRRVAIDVGAHREQDVVDAADQGHQIGLQLQRRLELALHVGAGRAVDSEGCGRRAHLRGGAAPRCQAVAPAAAVRAPAPAVKLSPMATKLGAISAAAIPPAPLPAAVASVGGSITSSTKPLAAAAGAVRCCSRRRWRQPSCQCPRPPPARAGGRSRPPAARP